MQHQLVTKAPDKCSPQELAAFVAVAEKSKEVDSSDLEAGVERARFLIWSTDSNGVVCVCALKVPNDSYWKGVFSKSNLRCQDYPLEFGYLYVEEGKRNDGRGSALLNEALRVAGDKGLFATTRSNNTDVHPFLKKRGFELAGQPYPSRRGDYTLLLFVRPTASMK